MRWDKWRKPRIEHNRLTEWNWMVQNPSGLDLHRYCDIGAFTYINAKNGVTISKNVQIGSHCSIYSVSTIDDKSGHVLIKAGAKIGSHSTIMPGVTIGKNCIIGAHSFVNRDIPDNCIAYGVPATLKRREE